ncbi:hypothetical protein LZC95_20005 [Pendulispora brunnea]|uniref:Pectinesterase inhibitor domain-containing protein n=1 Tax=Pendulispora brunnea TaxID=2905690 RepID=A0ABZ2KM13_9BACT
MSAARASWIMAFGCATLLATSQVGCLKRTHDAESPSRQTARATIVLVAKAVLIADQTCSGVAKKQEKASIAATCEQAYNVARNSLLTAESGVDAWDSVAQKDIACAIIESGRALKRTADAIQSAGVELPAIVVDALKLVPEFGSVCHG